MGLFSKKQHVCERCGKTFSKLINLNGNFCDDCWEQEQNEKKELESLIRGYIKYCEEVFTFSKSYSSNDMREIIKHRDAIMSKYQNVYGISRTELQYASDNYKTLTDEQAQDVLLRVASSSLSATSGAVYSTGKFFLPTQYDGVIVDAEDVFAVGFTSDFKMKEESKEVILCVLFTNDPYVPVFPMIYLGKKQMFDLFKSKKGREAVKATFEASCANLTYPPCDLKQLKKQIKQEGKVKGNLDEKFMLNQISSASVGTGIFDTKKMHSDMLSTSEDIVESMGYMMSGDIDLILKMDNMFNGKFWNKHMDKILNQ